MAKYIRTLTVFYDTEISYKEIPFFRGAVLKSLGYVFFKLYCRNGLLRRNGIA